ncbi:rhomboid family intramembrane serine protease [Aureimonas sp. AU12]|uniref:rhomboid family intramembrane serine protease n=1 Tax=Aureimonas sp. AU12 TaxID=1638161 RepID=UPI000AE549EE|nr:rhomboid family intramembrane serine protease [Aureimonas sp. AU12]
MSPDPMPRLQEPTPPPRVRAINVPGVVLALIALFALVHWVRTSVLSDVDAGWVLLNFAFIPGCYGGGDEICSLRDAWAGVVSPVSHAFLHGDWTHFGANAIWLLAFGTPVARRLGVLRFLVFSLIGAVAGAGLFYLLNTDLVQPMIGASGVVSALMGAASRFALGSTARPGLRDVAFAPRLSIGRSLTDRTILFFIAIFFATNVALGSGAAFLFGEVGSIAWEAHLGGFLFGFLCFAAFDPRHQHEIGLSGGPTA